MQPIIYWRVIAIMGSYIVDPEFYWELIKLFLAEVTMKNFRCFSEAEQTVNFHRGLNVLVGENDSGKSAVIDAIRIALGTTDQGWYRVDISDFHNEDKSKEISIICKFDDLSVTECAAFLECLTYVNVEGENKPVLYLHWKCKYLLNITPPRTSTSISTGLTGDGPQLTADARELLRVTYLKALRDAYNDMQSGRNSRLSQIVQSIPNLNSGINRYTEGMSLDELSITGIADLSNKLLSEHAALKQANVDVTTILKDKMLLRSDQLITKLQVSGTNAVETKKLESLLEKLDMTVDKVGSQNQGRVGLGTSNIMSMACELLLNNTNAQKGNSSFLLIEEPEAHIHAQRQLRLIQSLQNEAEGNSNQIILTTHSPLLASVISLENVTIMRGSKPFSLSKGQTLLDDDDYLYLERYLDATKANLFFAKSVIIVEGPAEELLLPTIAKLLGKDLTEHGVSIVNVRGIGLRRYARIFQRCDTSKPLSIPVACITDRDIMPDCAPAICINEEYTTLSKYPQNKRNWKTESEFASEGDKQKYILDKQEHADGQKVKTFVSGHWTFEYDLAYAGLMDEMIEALVFVKYKAQNRAAKLREIIAEVEARPTSEEKATVFYSYFYDNSTSKAEFAQGLAAILSTKYIGKPNELKVKLPEYILSAIDYVTDL